MLSKINRLTKKKDFDLVFKKGKSFKDDAVALKVLETNLNKIRVGFIVSKKVSTKASIRNKVKRRLRAAVLGQLKSIKKSADVVIIALVGIHNKEFIEVKGMVSSLFKKSFN